MPPRALWLNSRSRATAATLHVFRPQAVYDSIYMWGRDEFREGHLFIIYFIAKTTFAPRDVRFGHAASASFLARGRPVD
jgi:hypothetical protein